MIWRVNSAFLLLNCDSSYSTDLGTKMKSTHHCSNQQNNYRFDDNHVINLILSKLEIDIIIHNKPLSTHRPRIFGISIFLPASRPNRPITEKKPQRLRWTLCRPLVRRMHVARVCVCARARLNVHFSQWFEKLKVTFPRLLATRQHISVWRTAIIGLHLIIRCMPVERCCAQSLKLQWNKYNFFLSSL